MTGGDYQSNEVGRNGSDWKKSVYAEFSAWEIDGRPSLIVLFVWIVRVVRRTEYRLALLTNMEITRAEVNQWKKTTDARGCVTEIKKSIMTMTTDSV